MTVSAAVLAFVACVVLASHVAHACDVATDFVDISYQSNSGSVSTKGRILVAGEAGSVTQKTGPCDLIMAGPFSSVGNQFNVVPSVF